MTTFGRLKIEEWKQFQSLDIKFHPRLTILTGANGAGKSTLLNMLASHFGWNFRELSTPAQDEKGVFRYFTRFFKKSKSSGPGESVIGTLEYSNGSTANITVPVDSTPQYHVQVTPRSEVGGLLIPSHRPMFVYQSVGSISTRKRDKSQAFQLVSDSVRTRILDGGGGQTANYYIKETLLTWAIFGYGNKVIAPDIEQQGYFDQFQQTLRGILPQHLGFREFEIRNHEIVLITDSGDFMIDAVSGGVGAILDLAWQIYMYSKDASGKFVVLVDEMENHLHPTLQREILPNLLRSFPNVQFIVSTHSPLIVGSEKESSVYVLRHQEGRVVSESLDLVNKAKSASDVLRDVLGVTFTMPLWVEHDLNTIVEKYSKLPVTPGSMEAMRKDLAQIGLEDLVPQALLQLTT